MPTRSFAIAASLLAAAAGARAALVAQSAAERAGLVRAWYTQAPVAAGTQSVVGSKLLDGSLYVLTSAGMLVAYDAETGATRWSTRCGEASQPALGPTVYQWTAVDGVGESLVTRCGVVVGSTVHVLDADNGEIVLSRRLDGAAGAAPAISPTHVFVPQLGGRLIGYPFDAVSGLKRRVASPGQLAETPILAAGRVIWSTARGELYGAAEDSGRFVYRYDTTAPIAGPPSVVDAAIYFANREGFVYGMQAEKARPLWRNTIGVTVEKPVVALGGTLYVAAETPTLYAFGLEDGAERWRVYGLGEFVSASADRLYAVAPDGALGVLDRESGEPVASWPAAGPLNPVTNTESDRLYFVSDDGLVQCLHEAELAEPYLHNAAAEPPADETAAAETPDESAEPAAPASAEDEPADPPPAESPADDPFADPFSGGEDAPAEDPFGGGDPFGGDDPFGF